MAKDYARRRPQRRILTAGVASSRGSNRGGRKSGGPFKQLPYMIAGIFIGLAIAGFFYVKMQPMQVASHAQQQTTKVAHAKTKPTKVARHKVTELSAQKTEDSARYDFYTILTNDKPEVNEEEEEEVEDNTDDAPITAKKEAPPAAPKIAEATPAPAKKAPANSPKYALQIAALKKLEDADRLKAKLLLQGHDVYISKYTVKKVTVYRVNIGPYRTSANAKAQQRKLKEQHINSMLLTV